MNLLAALGGPNRLTLQYLLDKLVPAAGGRRVIEAVDSRGAQRADGPPLAQAVAVNERFQCGLVCSIVTFRPQWVRLVERAVAEDHVMHGTRGEEHAARQARL